MKGIFGIILIKNKKDAFTLYCFHLIKHLAEQFRSQFIWRCKQFIQTYLLFLHKSDCLVSMLLELLLNKTTSLYNYAFTPFTHTFTEISFHRKTLEKRDIDMFIFSSNQNRPIIFMICSYHVQHQRKAKRDYNLKVENGYYTFNDHNYK